MNKRLTMTLLLAAAVALAAPATAQQLFDFNGQAVVPAAVGGDLALDAIVYDAAPATTPIPLNFADYQYTLVITGLELITDGPTQVYAGGAIALYEDAATAADFTNGATFSDGTAILTGVVGRYLLYLVPRSKAGRQLQIGELDAQVRALNQEIEGAFVDRRTAGTMMTRVRSLARDEAQAKADADEDEPRTLVAAVMSLVQDDRAQRKAIEALGGELGEGVAADKKARVMRLLQKKARLERSLRRHVFLSRVLKRYRVVHVVASNVMFGALALHIVLSLMYQVGN